MIYKTSDIRVGLGKHGKCGVVVTCFDLCLGCFKTSLSVAHVVLYVHKFWLLYPAGGPVKSKRTFQKCHCRQNGHLVNNKSKEFLSTFL